MQQESNNNPRTLREYLRLFFTGVAMGAADIVPGVSGGTMAFILGVYQSLIDAIKSFNLDLIRLILKGDIRGALNHVPWRFLLALGGGILAAIFTLAAGLEFALHNYPIYLFSFFTGLIVASVIAVGANVRWNAAAVVALVIATVGAFVVMGLRPQDIPSSLPILFFSGMIAICAMILPGVSGAFLLLVLGQYEAVLGAVRAFDLVTIATVGAGAVIGLIAFSRVLSWLLHHFENTTVAALVGFMIGSLRVIYPFKAPINPLETYIDTEGVEVAVTRNVLPWVAQHVENLEDMVRLTTSEVVIALGLAVLGFILVSLLDHLQSGRNPIMRPFLGTRAAPAESQSATSGD